MTATAATLQARRAEAAALADQLADEIDAHPSPLLRERLHRIVRAINRIDGMIARSTNRQATPPASP
jgi:hypothetical protein